MAIRLPVSVVKALDLKEGDDIEILIADDRVFHLKRKLSAKDALAGLRKFRGKMPADFKFDQDDANARF